MEKWNGIHKPMVVDSTGFSPISFHETCPVSGHWIAAREVNVTKNGEEEVLGQSSEMQLIKDKSYRYAQLVLNSPLDKAGWYHKVFLRQHCGGQKSVFHDYSPLK